jgi:hypothetical protein
VHGLVDHQANLVAAPLQRLSQGQKGQVVPKCSGGEEDNLLHEYSLGDE